jgi:hypothetical protein
MLTRYLANLSPSKQVLWCYLIWYIVFVLLYFDPNPTIWLSSLGLSALIGFALLLGLEDSPRRWRQIERWRAIRLFLIPFCVSSFAASVKGHGFIVIFSPRLDEDLLALVACAVFLGIAWSARRRLREVRAAGR